MSSSLAPASGKPSNGVPLAFSTVISACRGSCKEGGKGKVKVDRRRGGEGEWERAGGGGRERRGKGSGLGGGKGGGEREMGQKEEGKGGGEGGRRGREGEEGKGYGVETKGHREGGGGGREIGPPRQQTMPSNSRECMSSSPTPKVQQQWIHLECSLPTQSLAKSGPRPETGSPAPVSPLSLSKH